MIFLLHHAAGGSLPAEVATGTPGAWALSGRGKELRRSEASSLIMEYKQRSMQEVRCENERLVE